MASSNHQLSFACYIYLVSASILYQFASSLLIPGSIHIGGHDVSIVKKEYPTFLHHSSSASLMLNMSKKLNNDGNKEKTMDIIGNQTLLSVETCINLHHNFQKDGQNENEKVVFIDASWWHKGNLDGRKM